MRFKMVGNKKETVCGVYLSDETTVTIKAGGPVFLKADGTVPGKSATSAETVAAALQTLFFGLAIANCAPLAEGEAQVYGFFDYARILLTSRSATDATWASYSAGALGDLLAINTVAAVQALQRTGAGSASVNVNWNAILGFTYASQTTQASSLGIAASQYWTSTGRVFIRNL